MSFERYTIRSVDRVVGSSSNFAVVLPYPADNVSKGILRRVILPHTIYNVRTGINDKLDFNDPDVGVSYITIPSGGYTINELLTVIQDAMNILAPLSYTCTYDQITLRVTIARSPGTFALLNGTGANATTSVREILGYSKSNTASGTSHVANNVFNLSKPLSLGITIDGLPDISKNSSGSITSFTFPLDVNFGSILYYDPVNKQTVTFNKRSFNRLNIRLSYPDGNTVPLNGSEWEFLLDLE